MMTYEVFWIGDRMIVIESRAVTETHHGKTKKDADAEADRPSSGSEENQNEKR